MSEISAAVPRSGVTWREAACVCGCALLVVVVELQLAQGFSLFQRHFWYDEVLTDTLVADPDWGHAFGALHDGVETHPPTLYLFMRILTVPFAGPAEVKLRLFALLTVLLGLAGLYLLLRQTFTVAVSFVAVLAVWSHPLVLTHALEARFYGPVFSATVWLAYLLVRARLRVSPFLHLGLGCCSVVLCTLHYFGVLSLALLLAWEWFFRPATPGRYNGLITASLGFLAGLACLPLMLHQRAAFTIATWVEPASLVTSVAFVAALSLPLHLVILVPPVWLTGLFQARHPQPETTTHTPENLTAQAGLTGMLLLPLVLVALSYGLQSVLVPRYGLPAVAALAPMVAYFLSRLSVNWLLCTGLVFLAWGVGQFGAFATETRERDAATTRRIEVIRTQTSDGVVVFQSVLDQCVVARYAPDVADRCVCLDFETGQIQQAHATDIFARDLVRRYARWYERPTLATWNSVQQLPRFYFVTAVVLKPWVPQDVFPHCTVRQVVPGIFELTPAPKNSP